MDSYVQRKKTVYITWQYMPYETSNAGSNNVTGKKVSLAIIGILNVDNDSCTYTHIIYNCWIWENGISFCKYAHGRRESKIVNSHNRQEDAITLTTLGHFVLYSHICVHDNWLMKGNNFLLF